MTGSPDRGTWSLSRVEPDDADRKLKHGIRLGMTPKEITEALGAAPPTSKPMRFHSQYTEARNDYPGREGERVGVTTYTELTITFDENDRAAKMVWEFYADRRPSLIHDAEETPMRTRVRFGTLLAFLPAICGHAQGLLPLPDVTGAEVDVSVERVFGNPAFGSYVYEYTVTNPAAATGVIWMFKVDVSARSRADRDDDASYPAQGGAITLPFSDDVKRLAPFFGGSRLCAGGGIHRAVAAHRRTWRLT